MDHCLAEGATVAFQHLLTLIGDQVKLDVALDGFSLVFGSDTVKSTPFFGGVSVVADDLSGRVFQSIEAVHHFAVGVAGLGNVDIVKRVLSDDGQFLRCSPFPEGDGLRDFDILELLTFSDVENLHDATGAVSAGFEGYDVLFGVHDGTFCFVLLASVVHVVLKLDDG